MEPSACGFAICLRVLAEASKTTKDDGLHFYLTKDPYREQIGA